MGTPLKPKIIQRARDRVEPQRKRSQARGRLCKAGMNSTQVKLANLAMYSHLAAHEPTVALNGCTNRIECFMEAVDDKLTPVLDRSAGHHVKSTEKLSTMQKSWARDGVVWLEEFLPHDLVDRYVNFWYKHAPDRGGWPYPTPYVKHKHIRDVALYPPLMEAMRELIGGEMILHLTLTGFQSTTRSWHQDDFLNNACVNSWYAAVWIALDDVHPHAGPFQFIPGSHRWPLLRQHKVKKQMKPEEVKSPSWPSYSERILEPLFEDKFRNAGLKPTDFVARKGDVLIWHGRLAHQGTRPFNTSLERRALIAHYTEKQHHLCSGVNPNTHIRDKATDKLYYKIWSDAWK